MPTSHTSSLAFSLLQHSSLPSESFVLSPFSLDIALAIIHDGASGKTQKELTKLLLKGSASEVAAFYSSLALNLPSAPPEYGCEVTFKTANRFYVDDTISLKKAYQNNMKSKYAATIENLSLSCKVDAAREMNSFVDSATEGYLKNVVQPDDIDDEARAVLVNVTYMHGKWMSIFQDCYTHKRLFRGQNGDREMDFMKKQSLFHFDLDSELGTVLILSYEDPNFYFFFLMPKETSNLEQLRNEITGTDLANALKSSKEHYADVFVPKFRVDSKLDAKRVLSNLGVKSIFNRGADLSKISSTPLFISDIKHTVTIEVDEEGTVAAAATLCPAKAGSGFFEKPPPTIVIDRPFLFGIFNHNYDFDSADSKDSVDKPLHILFLGQFC